MADRVLHVIAHGAKMGTLVQRHDRLSFAYDDDWRSRADAFALSLSVPLTAREHSDRVVAPFLWNLLPDNPDILKRWARRFDANLNAFALLEHVGEDVAGAAQFVRPERLEPILKGGGTGGVEWIGAAEIARRLGELRIDRSAWSQLGDPGYFSLAGAQPKLALVRQHGKWGIATGRTPTTHILKPPSRDLDGHAENEHFCLKLAGAVGLPVAASTLEFFEAEPAIVVERFDRIRQGATIRRVPLEDACQALGVHPDRKYQRDGGPGPIDILNLLARESAACVEDCKTFFDALAFNWLIGGTDAHAKNYSLLLGPAGRMRLAPFYDIASALPYHDPKRLKLAMKIGSHYELKEINARDWDKVGIAAGLGDGQHARVARMAAALPDCIVATSRDLRAHGLAHNVIGTLEKRLQSQAKTAALRLSAARRRS